jgi:DNA replication and repair protein RecF
MLTRIQIANLRNIAMQEIGDLSSVNVFLGDNGVGKTSVLEAIHTLGYGRSFRKQGGQKDALVRYGCERLVVFGESVMGGFGSVRGDGQALGVERMGLSRTINGDIQIKINGEKLQRLSEMAFRLPAIAVNSDTFDLLTGGAAERRRYLDWAVFHVEHNFRDVSKRYVNALQQRNSVLRRIANQMRLANPKNPIIDQDPHELSTWTQAVSDLGAQVGEYRDAQFLVLKNLFDEVLHELGGGALGVKLGYRCGWGQGVGLAEALEQGRSSDMNRGFTQFGPHRADIQVVVGKDVAGQARLARDVLSRGQLKLVVLAMKLAQVRFYLHAGTVGGLASKGPRVEVNSNPQVRAKAPAPGNTLSLLLDDIAAEFDETRVAALGGLLAEMLKQGGVQVFATSTGLEPLHPLLGPISTKDFKVFHVEHGQVWAAE